LAVRVKICGVRTKADGEHAMLAGADLLGLNLIQGSPRAVGRDEVERLVRQLAPLARQRGVQLIGVVADLPPEALDELLALGLDGLQLHGSESPEVLRALGPVAYKAVRIGNAEDVDFARTFPGERLLVDAKVPGRLGGTGVRVDWTLLDDLARTRELFLAGGLDPDNVAEAVRAVRPAAVDVASGVETSPGVKDPRRVELFIERAKSA
jgi:phosphoribosylanthranilate isomerase